MDLQLHKQGYDQIADSEAVVKIEFVVNNASEEDFIGIIMSSRTYIEGNGFVEQNMSVDITRIEAIVLYKYLKSVCKLIPSPTAETPQNAGGNAGDGVGE